jgi:hypothetical protein
MMRDGDDETAALERRAEYLRNNVDRLLDEADRRRHALMETLDVRRQARLHPGVVLGIAGGLLALAVALPILGVRRARRRNSLSGRTQALRLALSRMMRRPDRVAEGRPHLPMKVLSAALAAAASTLAKKELGRLLSSRPRHVAALAPVQQELISSQ